MAVRMAIDMNMTIRNTIGFMPVLSSRDEFGRDVNMPTPQILTNALS